MIQKSIPVVRLESDRPVVACMHMFMLLSGDVKQWEAYLPVITM